jgi:hypothetical protein
MGRLAIKCDPQISLQPYDFTRTKKSQLNANALVIDDQANRSGGRGSDIDQEYSDTKKIRGCFISRGSEGVALKRLKMYEVVQDGNKRLSYYWGGSWGQRFRQSIPVGIAHNPIWIKLGVPKLDRWT